MCIICIVPGRVVLIKPDHCRVINRVGLNVETRPVLRAWAYLAASQPSCVLYDPVEVLLTHLAHTTSHPKMAANWPGVMLLTVSLIVPQSIVSSEECPSLPEKANRSLPYALNVRGSDSTSKSEFLCSFYWTDAEHLKEKLLDRLTNRQKRFVRFTVPVLGFNNPYLSMSNYSGYLTWVWVLDSHEYMLYYPHNFIVISVKTMGIITQDWAIDYSEGKATVPVSLKMFGLDPDDFDTHDIVGYCDPECIKVNHSCGIGKYELEEFLVNVTEGKEEFKWNWLCLQAPYDVQDIVSVPSFAFPDLLYYWRFLRMFLNRRPYFGTMKSKTDFPHYYCYNRKDNCELKELLKHYWLIPTIGFLMWLYSPLLIHYFPSSTHKEHNDSEVPKHMFPSYKTPIYMGRCLKWILCFYMKKVWAETKLCVRFRRVLFLIGLVTTSYRLFVLPPYYYYSWPLLTIAFVSVLIPDYLSEHISAELPSRFLFWDLPAGLVRTNRNSIIEYQQLAHVMQERLYLTVDIRFWNFLFKRYRCCCNNLLIRISPGNISKLSVVIRLVLMPLVFLFNLVIFVTACIINVLLFYLIPLPYFYMELLRAVCVGRHQYIRQFRDKSSPYQLVIKCTSTCHAIVMIGLLIYTMVVTYVWCYAISEFTMFTFIGGALTSSMAFQYFVLTGSVVTAIYTLVSDLHEEYSCILEEMIKILKEKRTFTKLAYKLSGNKLVLERDSNELYRSIIVRKDGESLPQCKLLIDDGITTYLDKGLYNETVERCRPLRRKIVFIILKIVAIFFYCVIAFWVKNVYHLEDKVEGIFQMVTTVAVYFLPSMLQFISHKSHFGKKSDIILRQEIYESLSVYLGELSY